MFDRRTSLIQSTSTETVRVSSPHAHRGHHPWRPTRAQAHSYPSCSSTAQARPARLVTPARCSASIDRTLADSPACARSWTSADSKGSPWAARWGCHGVLARLVYVAGGMLSVQVTCSHNLDPYRPRTAVAAFRATPRSRRSRNGGMTELQQEHPTRSVRPLGQAWPMVILTHARVCMDTARAGPR